MSTCAVFSELVAGSSWIPPNWRADPGRVTPNGNPALFRSNAHANMAIRVLYLETCGEGSRDVIRERCLRYNSAWDTYVAHGHHMQSVVVLHEQGELTPAVEAWNRIDQEAVDTAYRAVIGEREEHHLGVSLALHARRHFCLIDTPTVSADKQSRDRPLRPADNTAAWARSPGGICRGCGSPTISHSQRAGLHTSFKKFDDLFNLEPRYQQHNRIWAALWPQVTIAAKGVAEHIIPRSQGGRTSVANLTNACAACNYSRGDTSMDATGVAAYDRPPDELNL